MEAKLFWKAPGDVNPQKKCLQKIFVKRTRSSWEGINFWNQLQNFK